MTAAKMSAVKNVFILSLCVVVAYILPAGQFLDGYWLMGICYKQIVFD